MLANTGPGTGHDQLAVNGDVNLGGAPGATLDLAYIITAGTGPFVIVNNDGGDLIAGRFETRDVPGDSLEDGETISVDASLYKYPFRIEYDFNAATGLADNSGNDVALLFDPNVIVPATPGDDEVLSAPSPATACCRDLRQRSGHQHRGAT